MDEKVAYQSINGLKMKNTGLVWQETTGQIADFGSIS